MKKAFLILLLFFENLNCDIIMGRNHEPIYHIEVPNDWKRMPVTLSKDTMNPIAEYLIDDDIQVTIHNFPTDTMNQRIAPISQINRWKGQFQSLDPLTIQIEPQSFSGFSGMMFEGSGMIDNKPTTVLAWSMIIGTEHYQQLMTYREKDRQQRADFTIKVVGPPEKLEKNKSAIIPFARSFELIEEIPNGR